MEKVTRLVETSFEFPKLIDIYFSFQKPLWMGKHDY